MSSTQLMAAKRSIRRALQKPLYDAVLAAGILLPDGRPAIKWPGIPFPDRKTLPARSRYFDAELIFGSVLIHEIGDRPMAEGKGGLSIVTRTPGDEGEDANDVLAGIIASAYPYASTPTFSGVEVCIDKIESGSYGSDGPWLTGLTRVYWTVYRRP